MTRETSFPDPPQNDKFDHVFEGWSVWLEPSACCSSNQLSSLESPPMGSIGSSLSGNDGSSEAASSIENSNDFGSTGDNEKILELTIPTGDSSTMENSGTSVDSKNLGSGSSDSGSETLSPFMIKLDEIKTQAKYKTQYLYLLMMLYCAPMLLYFAPIAVITTFFWVGYISMVVVSLNLLGELFGSLHSWKVRRKIHRSKPEIPSQHLAAIVSAYLPNEIDILEDTLTAMRKCKLPNGCTLTILVSHNGGKPYQQQRLRDIISSFPSKQDVMLEEVDHPTSRSKAENVNGALDYLKAEGKIRPQTVVLYDADHQPDKNAMVYALETMVAKNADLLQGRCCINRGSTMIAAEFDTLYGVNHAGGEVVHGFAFFGGTNGFWKFDLLDEIRMDTSMLTEDVDSAFRYSTMYEFRLISNHNTVEETFRRLRNFYNVEKVTGYGTCFAVPATPSTLPGKIM